MKVLDTHCAGLAVHQQSVVATVIVADVDGGWYQATQTLRLDSGQALRHADRRLADALRLAASARRDAGRDGAHRRVLASGL